MIYRSIYVGQESAKIVLSNSESWVILSPLEAKLKAKIEARGKKLSNWDINIYRGILTGYNDAFIISTEKRDELIAADPKSAEIIRPILRGRDIHRYGYDFANLWLLFVPWHFPLQDDESITGASDKAETEFALRYPAVYNHLLQHKGKLEQRNKAETGKRYEWYALQRWGAKYWNDFSVQKIMYNDISQKLSFALVPENVFCVNTVYFIKDNPKLLYLLGCLNAKITDWYYRTLSVQLGEKAVRMFSIYVERLPIPILPKEKEQEIVSLVIKLLNTSERIDDSNHISAQIDKIIYGAFNLNDEEIELIEAH